MIDIMFDYSIFIFKCGQRRSIQLDLNKNSNFIYAYIHILKYKFIQVNKLPLSINIDFSISPKAHKHTKAAPCSANLLFFSLQYNKLILICLNNNKKASQSY